MTNTPDHQQPAHPEELGDTPSLSEAESQTGRRPNLGRSPNGILPAFTPVPRLCDRSNGWKPEVQRAFIEALAETGSVKAACRRVGRADHGVYQLRRHPEADEFRAAWDAALDLGIRRIEDAAMDRALYGVEETFHYHGALVGTRTRHNERLVMFMLRNRAGDRFAEGGGARGLNAVDKHMLARLKKQWRAEWERERAILAAGEEDAIYASIDTSLEDICADFERINQRERALWSPRTRELHAAWERSLEDDKASGYAWMREARRVEAAEEEEKKEIAIPLPAPSEEADEEMPGGPRIRSVKDDGW